jgi:PAS domain S-box-containing protein
MPKGRGSAFQVVLIYAFVAALWILLSDEAVESLFQDPALIIKASMIKGWLFVAVTSLLLYGLVRRLTRRIEAAHEAELAMRSKGQNASKLLEAIATTSEDGIFAKDTDGRYLLFNPAAERATGIPAREAIGRDDHALFPAELANSAIAADRQVMSANTTLRYEQVIPGPLGNLTVDLTKMPLRDDDGKLIGLFGIARDITARKAAEVALRESEQRFQDIVRATGDWVWEVDAAGRYTYTSDSVQDLLGYSPAEVIGKTPFDFMPPQEAERVGAEFAAISARRDPIQELRNTNVHKSGRLVHVSTSGIPVISKDGQLLGYRGIDRDITARRAAEEQTNKLALAVEQSPESIVITNLDAKIEYVNESFLRATGYSRDEVIGRNPRILPCSRAGRLRISITPCGMR